MSHYKYGDELPPLSLRALGLLEMFRNAKKVIPTNELRAQVLEGRDAILKAKQELRNAGYVKTTKSQINGQWSTSDVLVDLESNIYSTESG
jgi:hypothetical protein